MTRPLRLWVAGLGIAVGANAAVAQTYATPLPPGPGTVALPIPCGPMVAPVLMPVGAPTAAPVAIYHYPGFAAANSCQTPSYTPANCGSRLSVSAEFLLWFTQANTLPPLATAAAPGIAVPPGGSLGRPDTNVVFGGGRADTALRPGARLGVGYALSDCSAVESRFFFLGDSDDHFDGGSVPGRVTLGRPLTFVPTSQPTAVPAAFLSGVATTRLLGWELDYRRKLECGGCGRLDLLVGYRYLHLGDRVEVFHTSPFGIVGVGDTSGPGTVSDSVRSRNAFYGPQVGLGYRRPLRAGFSLDVLAKVALGATVARADLDGSTVVGQAGVPVGLLVGPSNTRHDSTTYFGVVPEAGLGFGYEVCESLRLSAGYTLLYWSQVRRAADQIDLAGGAAGRPAFRDVTGDYWAQGVRLGLEFRY